VRAQRDRAWSEHKEGSSGGSSWLASLLGTMTGTQALPHEHDDAAAGGAGEGAPMQADDAIEDDVGSGVNLTGTLMAIDRCASRSHAVRLQ
jgi:hypothetical protein